MAACDAALAQLPMCDLVIVISPSAVMAAASRLTWLARPFSVKVPYFAVGRGTARALEQQGVSSVIYPPEGADSEHLLALPELHTVQGKRILLIRGEGGRSLLADTLLQRGAEVLHAVCYARQPVTLDIAAIVDTLDAVTVTSREIVEIMLGKVSEGSERLLSLPWFVPHPRIAEAVRAHGIESVYLADAGDAGMIKALEHYFAHDSA